MKPLLPERHPDQDFFIADFGDVIPKSDIASMEHPLFTLSTKPDTKIKNYKHNGNEITITPSVMGLATIHDKDILIYCISQLMAGINRGETPNSTIRFKAHDLLVSTNRQINGQGYALLKKALKRLKGTVIETNIITGKKEKWSVFGILEKAEIVREINGRMTDIEVTFPEWLYNSILENEVLSLNRKYFRLRKPLERRLYEIARKHCSHKQQWKIGLEKLHKKCGSSSTKEKFKHMLNHIVKHNHLPDYSITIEENNVILFTKNLQSIDSQNLNRPHLKIDTLENAKKIVHPLRLDVYTLQEEWLEFWRSSGKPELASPDGAFINFCKRKII